MKRGYIVFIAGSALLVAGATTRLNYYSEE